VGTPPDYDERLVLEELTSTDKKAVFDIKNKLRFPFTIDYLNILVIWLKDVKEKLEQVNALYMQLCSELKTATVKSSKNESEANNRKHMSGVVAGTLTVASAAGLGVLYATSALLTGGISLPIIGGGVAVYSASRFLSFRKVESGGKVLTKELDSLLETATVLKGITHVVKCAEKLEKEKKVIDREDPHLLSIKKSFEKIFKLLKNSEDVNKAKMGLRQTGLED
jgi:hypothetical protein